MLSKGGYIINILNFFYKIFRKNIKYFGVFFILKVYCNYEKLESINFLVF